MSQWGDETKVIRGVARFHHRVPSLKLTTPYPTAGRGARVVWEMGWSDGVQTVKRFFCKKFLQHYFRLSDK